MYDQPYTDLRERIDHAVGAETEVFAAVQGGYTVAGRWTVTTTAGDSVFVKVGLDQQTAAWLRREHDAYAALRAPFMPTLIAWADDGVEPILVLEDLRGAVWPPPWSDARVASVVDTLAVLRTLEIPCLAHKLSDNKSLADECWRAVAMDPRPFLSLGLASPKWLDAALTMLLTAEQFVDLDEAGSLLHMDVRSDNLCFVGDAVKLVDWNHACTGNAAMDLGAWLPSLHAEGGPPPEELLDDPTIAAKVSGYFAARAGLPEVPSSPRLRQVQLAQLRAALPWAVRALELPPLDL
jgi:hypothetical protein